MSFTSENINFIKKCLKKNPNLETCDYIRLFKRQFPYVSLKSDQIRSKVREIARNMNTCTQNNDNTADGPVQRICNVVEQKYTTIRKFSEEQTEVLTRNNPELDIATEFKMRWPDIMPQSLQLFHIWIAAANYRKMIHEKNLSILSEQTKLEALQAAFNNRLNAKPVKPSPPISDVGVQLSTVIQHWEDQLAISKNQLKMLADIKEQMSHMNFKFDEAAQINRQRLEELKKKT